MSRGQAMQAVMGGDRPVPTAVPYSEPKPKQTGLDWAKICPPAEGAPPPAPEPTCRNCGARLVNKVCRVCTELEEARRDATFTPPAPEVVAEPIQPVEKPEPIKPAPGALWELPQPSLQFEWAQLLRDTADSTDRTIVSARFLALAALEHLRLTAAEIAPVAAPQAAKRQRKVQVAAKPASERPKRGRPRANTKAIVDAYTSGKTIDETAAETGHDKGTVRRHLLSAGVELRDDRHTRSGGANRREDTAEQIEDVRRLYVDERLSQSRVAERLGLGVKIVQGIMRRNGIAAREGQSGGGDTLVEIKDRLARLGVKSSDVRAWARGQGLEVSERGVIPTKLLDQYQAAR